ncbi:MAG: aminotransferase class V-fold PLP-dependent enzyme [Deltaproteobacteria bacterium]|nr:aminotransferase class V-fold PLP-dependent enzyme [Deltaproteobacteria bacterium]
MGTTNEHVSTSTPPAEDPRFDAVLHWVRQQVVGRDATIRTPFGTLPKRYFDYTASGLPFAPIEQLVLTRVLPWMANTHTDASAVGGYMTRLYDDAHATIARHVHAAKDDVVVLCGSGATGAINKLVRAIGLLVPEPIERIVQVRRQIKDDERAVVFISKMEHHSNDLPWRESVADVVMVGFDQHGRVSAVELEALLSDARYAKRPLKIGSFCAASNVTGIKNDVDALAAAMHRHGGFACFDYAAAAPYVDIDLHPNDDPALRKDAVFISMHKFLGGPQAPGLLVANQALFRSRVPVEPGGGTVIYTSPWDWRYTEELSHREEGGTPNVVGVIRAGLAIELKEKLGTERIRRVEESFVRRAIARWSKHPKLHILGDLDAERLAIVSLIVDEGRLHHNLAARMLSDRWGIQTRGGCMCAGTYGHELLGIGAARSFEIRCSLDRGDEASKPGWLRISFSPATTEEDFGVLLDALPELAERYPEWAKDYTMDQHTAMWRHKDDRLDVGDRPLRLEVPG